MNVLYCLYCKTHTEFRNLQCDECKKTGKRCIDICTLCGNEIEEDEFLEPCPFCGKKVQKSDIQFSFGTKDEFYEVGCDVCQVTFSAPTKEGAISMWNRRSKSEERQLDCGNPMCKDCNPPQSDTEQKWHGAAPNPNRIQAATPPASTVEEDAKQYAANKRKEWLKRGVLVMNGEIMEKMLVEAHIAGASLRRVTDEEVEAVVRKQYGLVMEINSLIKGAQFWNRYLNKCEGRKG